MKILIAALLLLTSCASDERSVSACKALAPTASGTPSYCCSFCSGAQTKLTRWALAPDGTCTLFCNACLPSGYTNVQQCPDGSADLSSASD